MHKLTVTKSGYQDYLIWVRITIGKTATVHATLKVKGESTPVPTTIPTTVPTTAPTQTPSSDVTGSFAVTFTPTGAMVYLDGTYKGTTPITLSGISVGIHSLKVSKKYGYQDYYGY